VLTGTLGHTKQEMTGGCEMTKLGLHKFQCFTVHFSIQ